jgi:hypothetical protein
MATPARLVQLQCPVCHAYHWEIDCDYHGSELVGDKELSYAERTYRCQECGTSGTGYHIGDKSPPEFFLQPHEMYPMSVEQFDLGWRFCARIAQIIRFWAIWARVGTPQGARANALETLPRFILGFGGTSVSDRALDSRLACCSALKLVLH